MKPVIDRLRAAKSKTQVKENLKDIPMSELQAKLESSPDGISQDEASRPLSQYGANEIKIADGNSVEQPKPAPDLFLYAADLLRLKPSQCVVVEDAAVGIEAALAGGMWTIGLGSSDRFKTANVIFPNLIDVRWSNLQLKLKASVRVDK